MLIITVEEKVPKRITKTKSTRITKTKQEKNHLSNNTSTYIVNE